MLNGGFQKLLKQYLSLDLMLNNEKMLKGYDFTFKQYCNALNNHIPIQLNETFKDLFIRNFLRRYFYVSTIADDYDLFFDYLESEFAVILPVYEKRYNLINSLTDADLFETTDTESITDSNGKANSQNTTDSNSSAESKSYGSEFPEEIVDYDSINYSNSGTHTESSGTGKNVSNSDSNNTEHSETKVKNKFGNRLDRSEMYLRLQMNIFDDLLNEFKNLFIMIY